MKLIDLPSILLLYLVACEGAAISGPGICITPFGHKSYDQTREICCNGSTSQRRRNIECCGGKQLFNNTMQICCNNKVEEKFKTSPNCERKNAGCGEQICCGNQLLSRESDRDSLSCCGTEVINSSIYGCCGGHKILQNNSVSDCCDGESFDPAAEECVDYKGKKVIFHKHERKCHNQLYDRRNKGCCSGTLYDTPELNRQNFSDNVNFICCDNLLMKPKEKCCRKHHTGYSSHTISMDMECCGDTFYNPKNQSCHNGMPTELGEICGNEIITTDQDLKCCAAKYSYNSSQKCCDGSYSSSVISKHLGCCNGKGYDSTTYLCCGNTQIAEKAAETDNECCHDTYRERYTTYNNKTQFCSEGNVKKMKHTKGAWCGGKVYFPNKQMCCNDVLITKTESIDSCCDKEAYSSKTKMCCGSRVYEVSPQDGSCCDGQMFIKGSKSNKCIQQCSANETYDDSYQMCCQSVVHTVVEEHSNYVRCCGKDMIDIRTEKCCGSQFPFKGNSNIKCCGGRELFKKTKFVCKKNRVVSNDTTYRWQNDVQKLCHKDSLRYSEGWVKYGCTSKHVIQGTVDQINIMRTERNNEIKLLMKDVKSLDRGQGFLKTSIPKELTFIIKVRNNKYVKCRRRNFLRSCNGNIVFFNSDIDEKSQIVEVSKNSKIFMVKNSKRMKKSVERELDFKFCQKNFH